MVVDDSVIGGGVSSTSWSLGDLHESCCSPGRTRPNCSRATARLRVGLERWRSAPQRRSGSSSTVERSRASARRRAHRGTSGSGTRTRRRPPTNASPVRTASSTVRRWRGRTAAPVARCRAPPCRGVCVRRRPSTRRGCSASGRGRRPMLSRTRRSSGPPLALRERRATEIGRVRPSSSSMRSSWLYFAAGRSGPARPP